MPTSGSRRFAAYPKTVFRPALFLLLLAIAVAGPAQPAEAPVDAAKADQQIRVTSDRLTANRGTNYAEFIGNVIVTQGSTIIKADRIKIYFQGTPSDRKATVSSAESIQEIVASGKVTINFENKVAVTEKAVYNTASQVLVLSGAGSKITSGSDSIAGETITLNRADGHINIERGSQQRVEAVFYSTPKKPATE